MSNTLIIAEAGVNHNGNLEMAKDLVTVAKNAGADIVKFQTFKAQNIATETSPKADYQIRNSKIDESQLQMLKKLELDEFSHDVLLDHCKDLEIEFLSTAFDEESIELLYRKGLRRFKVPSGELTNLPYLQHVAKVASEIILSTGMATLDEVGAAVEVIESSGMSRDNLTILHCVTDYPANLEDANLRAMNSMAEAFGVRVGYSDHTTGFEAAIAAVAMGASIIEKHFTLDKHLTGPDHSASLDPSELKKFVTSIRRLELALGDGVKRPVASELRNASRIRRSIVAAEEIQQGEEFNMKNLCMKRPGEGISPMRIYQVIGNKACRNFRPDEIIEIPLEDFD
jgi:N,N'-diacetyllegionaminate synthase